MIPAVQKLLDKLPEQNRLLLGAVVTLLGLWTLLLILTHSAGDDLIPHQFVQ